MRKVTVVFYNETCPVRPPSSEAIRVEIPPVLKDHIPVTERVVSNDGFYCE